MFDFELRQPLVLPLDRIDPGMLSFNFNGFESNRNSCPILSEIVIKKHPPGFDHYKAKFDRIHHHLRQGNSYLVNLTQPIPIEINLTMDQIYHYGRAKYKLIYRNRFVFFSPEIFVRIYDDRIFTYPMKGTIDATIPDAERKILEDEKELAEHVTVVDLLRNDLSTVARDVRVDRFRYLDLIRTPHRGLWQVSSMISGQLEPNWPARLGTILMSLLPAGSISGAPKPSTLRIIRDVEGYERGFYTGIAGVFDGRTLDSCVMIRFIENCGGQLMFKSGGGITVYSRAEAEYQEMVDKVDVPIC